MFTNKTSALLVSIDNCFYFVAFLTKGPSIKGVRSQGGGEGFVQCGHFSDKGGGGKGVSSDGAARFFKIYDVFTRTGGVEPVRTFCGQGGGWVNLSRCCADALYGRPLIIIVTDCFVFYTEKRTVY